MTMFRPLAYFTLFSALSLLTACGNGHADAIGEPPAPDGSAAPPSFDAGDESDGSDGGPDAQTDAPEDAGYCAQCETVAVGGFVQDFAVDDENIYWNGLVSITKVPLDGGSPVTLTSSQANAVAVAVDSANVYWTSDDVGLVKIPIDGGVPTTLTSQLQAIALTVDATNVYFTGFGTNNRNLVMSVPIAGGPIVTLASAGPSDYPVTEIFVDPANVYWVTPVEDCDAAVCSENVMKVPLDGGAATPVFAAPEPDIVTIEGGNIIWIPTLEATASFTVMSTPVDGGAATQIASGPGTAGEGALDSTTFYWIDHSSGNVMSTPVGGGPATLLGSGQQNGWGLILHGRSLYWDHGQEEVLRLPLP